MRRQLRISEVIRHQLTLNIRQYSWRDHHLNQTNINITEVRVSPDLKHATVFILPLNAADYDAQRRELLMASLNQTVPPLRKLLAKAKILRFVPNLHFIWDTAYDESARIDALLNQHSSSS